MGAGEVAAAAAAVSSSNVDIGPREYIPRLRDNFNIYDASASGPF